MVCGFAPAGCPIDNISGGWGRTVYSSLTILNQALLCLAAYTTIYPSNGSQVSNSLLGKDMHRFLLLVATIMMAACATEPVKSRQTPDAFIRAANSWEGADIREMMAAWPGPNTNGRDAQFLADHLAYGGWYGF